MLCLVFLLGGCLWSKLWLVYFGCVRVVLRWLRCMFGVSFVVQLWCTAVTFGWTIVCLFVLGSFFMMFLWACFEWLPVLCFTG